jgi:hypothetical protein
MQSICSIMHAPRLPQQHTAAHTWHWQLRPRVPDVTPYPPSHPGRALSLSRSHPLFTSMQCAAVNMHAPRPPKQHCGNSDPVSIPLRTAQRAYPARRPPSESPPGLRPRHVRERGAAGDAARRRRGAGARARLPLCLARRGPTCTGARRAGGDAAGESALLPLVKDS